MTPFEAVRAARHMGLTIEPDGAHLKLNARLKPPPWLHAALREHKQEILALLQTSDRGMTQEEWLVFREERAAILEHDHGLPRLAAEICAIEQTQSEREHPGWLPPAKPLW